MILLQLSSGQGPIECAKAVGLCLKLITKRCEQNSIDITIVESVPDKQKGCFKSVLLQLMCSDQHLVRQFSASWQGAILWQCQSPFRPKHKRKNWFISITMHEIQDTDLSSGITYKACRASGAGGQHVNTTDSAIHATHTQSGISVKVQSERSQHTNKRIAKALLFQKLENQRHNEMSEQENLRWQQHWEVQRGNPRKVFKGDKFAEVS